MASSSEGFKCSICLEFYSGSSFKDYFVSTPGGHVFHYSCIKKLIEAGHSCCPMCREHLSLETLTRLYGIDPSHRPKSRPSSGGRSSGEDEGPGGKPDYVFKIVLVGDSSVGKSSLLKRFTTGAFQTDLAATTGCDLCFKVIEMGNKLIKLTIWDTVGQEKFRSVATNCIRNTHGIMLVYDVTDSQTFASIESWLKFAEDYAPEEAVKILIGNKLDVGEEQRMVPQRHGKSLASRLNLSFFETSAKEANNVEAAFRCLVGEIMEMTVLNPNSEHYDGHHEDAPPVGGGALPRSHSGCRIRLPRVQNCDRVPSPSPDCLC